MTFTLKQVETFRTVYETESVTAAARRLDVSPATVSATLAALEASIELRLFERVRQRMQRTPEATLLYEEIRRLNVGLESLGRKIRAIRGAAQPRLRIGCIHAYSGAVVSDAISRFRRRYPDTPLYLQIRDSNTLRDMVVSGELDLAVVADESELEGLRGHRLASLRAVAVFPAAHGLARLARVDFPHLADLDVIALNAEDGSRKRLDSLLRQAGLSLRVAIETPYSSTVCQLALAGHGVGIANPATAVGMEAAGLCYRPLTAPVHFECHMILHGSRPLSEAGKFWATCLRGALAPLVDRFGV
ncbi:LysR family transcriptional regulator [Achromobacter marplatensis]|uniref:LysR family transcriptional regulator n=1 Tax=Achromobacter marplatensis TaxID=470868 RepID=A0AA42W7X5_9BURK|nr:LysR family transcriptional regulator [Achromobacter marplatensis]EJO32090.1 LysR family transcriptional regulator [Achromobacter marplatensis]MDH2049087.1 LysR family transcriptional regulator [Achromobacter marplatensis]